MREVKALIVGGGASGLALSYELQGNTLLVEKEDRVGGLCRSIEHDGGVFDIGGHSFHTPHPEVYELVQNLVEGGLYLQQRDARVYSHGAIIPYPFQKNYDQIPNPQVVQECDDGLRAALGHAREAVNFEEYIVRKFGEGIAEHFMLPYNRKLWARDIREISCEWTSERVAGAKGEQERFDTYGGKRKPLQGDTKVGYPKHGGYEEIYKSFVPHLPEVALNSEIVHIVPNGHKATTADGREYRYRFMASTMPLPRLTQITEGVPDEIVRLAQALSFMSVYVALILVGRQLETPIQRLYVADPTIPPHKIALNHNSSDYLRKRPRHAIMAEVSYSDLKPLKVDEIVPKTIDFLVSCRILNGPEDVIWHGYIDANYAYPVYTHERPKIVQQIKDWYAIHDIYTLGRFGDWEYINSDKCVMKALTLGRKLQGRYA